MKPDLFTMEPGHYYAWQMFPGYGDAPYCSPILVEAITPLKRGNGAFELRFINCFYAEGVQDFTKQLRTVQRTPEFLVAEETPGGRTVVISALTDSWAHKFGQGYTEERLRQELGHHHPPLSLDCIVPNHIYLGAFPHEQHIPYLQSLGINAVLSIVDDHDPHLVCERVRSSFEWAQIPVRDSLHGGVPTVEDLADAVAVLRQWKANGVHRIYVHCVAGKGRSPLAVMAYLVHGSDGHDKMRLTKAIAQVTNRRSLADPNVKQLAVLADYVDRGLQDRRFEPRDYRPSSRVIRQTPVPASPAEGPALQFHHLRDRYRGAMIGLAVGDALGVPLEFKSPGTFQPVSEIIGGGPFGLKPGEWTDDTSMALCLAESLITRQGFDARDQLERYLAWYREGHLSSKGHCFDIGNTVREALTAFERTRRTDVGASHPRSAGNGSLMRLAPAPLFFSHDPALALAQAAESSRTTHAHPEAVDACRFFAGLIVGALNGATKEELLSPRYSPVSGYYEAYPLHPAVDAIALGCYKDKQPPEIRGRGYVVDALEASLWAFYHGNTFEEGCKLAVNLGNDADTTGAIYGQLAGAYYGESAIPERWRSKLVDVHRIGWFAEALLVSSLKPTLPAPKQAFLHILNPATLMASDDPRDADDFGPGLFLEVEKLVTKPLSPRFDVSDCCVAEPESSTYLYVPELDEDDL